MIDTSERGRQVTADQVRAVGVALGYPACCIDAFLGQHQRTNAEMRFAALRRTTGPASLLLNDLLDRGALVSHMVCRYDCPPSLLYARALAEALGPPARRDLESRLGGLMVVFGRGGVLRLVPAAPSEAGRYRFAAVEASGEGPEAQQWRAALQDADAVEVTGERVRVLRAGAEIGRLDAPPGAVQIRLFV
jgi:hypothetical protein